MSLPLYEMKIKEEDEESGVSKISLVKNPAIQSNHVYFKEDKKPIYFNSDTDRRLVTSAIMIPNLPIYRNDNGQEYEVVFSKDTIEKMRDKYLKEVKLHEVNVDHTKDVSNVFMVETGIVDKQRGINAPKGLDLKEGTWWATFRVENDEVWKNIKNGEFNGFSLEGVFDLFQMFECEKFNKTVKNNLKSSILDTNLSYNDRLKALNKLIKNV